MGINRMVLCTSAASSLGLAAIAVAQLATTGLIATDAGHDRIIEFTLPPNPLGILWEGPPLNQPTGMIEHWNGAGRRAYLVSNAGDGSIVAFDRAFTSYETVVEPGISTMTSPSDIGLHYKTSGSVYVLDANDGSVHRFDEFTGQFIDILIAPLAPASSMTVTSTPYPEFRPVIIIAYPTLGKVLRYNAFTGVLMNTVAEVERPAWVSPTNSYNIRVFEDFADPNKPNVVRRFSQEGHAYSTRRETAPGKAPNDVFSVPNALPTSMVFDDRLENFWARATIPAGPGSKLDNLIEYGWCYAQCDNSSGMRVLDIFDFLCFQNSWVKGEAYACDCDTSTGPATCDIFDFLCYQYAFTMGCP